MTEEKENFAFVHLLLRKVVKPPALTFSLKNNVNPSLNCLRKALKEYCTFSRISPPEFVDSSDHSR